MTGAERAATVAAAERWFEDQGLPYFVHSHEAGVQAALQRRRLVPLGVVAVLLGCAAGAVVGWLARDASTGVLVAALVAGAVLAAYALAALHLQPILRWAVRRTFGSLGWLFPLVTRALPLLLLFITFLFINTEVWQVNSDLDRGLLWLAVLLFAAVATAFLLVRLPEEVRRVTGEAEGERLVGICRGTPVEDVAPEVVGGDELSGGSGATELAPLQQVNLVLVLLVSQALQVLLLALSVFVFFLVFGKVAISDHVINTWVGGGAPHPLPSLSWLPISNELFQVSVFLAAFSGLYFTVYAVTDQNYRNQFFTSVSTELERAVGVHTVYRTLTSP